MEKKDSKISVSVIAMAIVIALITAIAVRRKKKAVSPEADLPEDWFKDEPKK